jgi:hypothetical protein
VLDGRRHKNAVATKVGGALKHVLREGESTVTAIAVSS